MSVAAGAGSGASTGAAIGSFIPGPGTLIGAGLGAVIGAGFGLAQHGKRKVQGQRNAMRAGLIYEHEKKAKERNRSILEGQLTIGAMQNTAQSREAAIQVAQEEGMREVALGQSGMSGGTPFYSLDSEIQQNVQRLSDLSYMQNADLSGRIAQANNQLDGSDMRMQEAIWGMQDANEQMAYLDSDVAAALSMGTGALAGMSMANNVMEMGTKMGMDKWFQKDPSVAAATSQATASTTIAKPSLWDRAKSSYIDQTYGPGGVVPGTTWDIKSYTVDPAQKLGAGIKQFGQATYNFFDQNQGKKNAYINSNTRYSDYFGMSSANNPLRF